MSNWTDDEDNKTHTGKSKICLAFILWLGAIFEIFSMTLRLFLSLHLSTGDSSLEFWQVIFRKPCSIVTSFGYLDDIASKVTRQKQVVGTSNHEKSPVVTYDTCLLSMSPEIARRFSCCCIFQFFVLLYFLFEKVCTMTNLGFTYWTQKDILPVGVYIFNVWKWKHTKMRFGYHSNEGIHPQHKWNNYNTKLVLFI